MAVCLFRLKGQGDGFVSFAPFVQTWGALLLPGLMLWLAATMWIGAITKNWVSTYAVSLLVLGGSIYATAREAVDWSTNWLLWGTLRWTDMGAFIQDKEALLLNRSWVLLLAILLVLLTAMCYHRHRQRPTPKKYANTAW